MSSTSAAPPSCPKLDIERVERDEERAEFLAACSNLDAKAVHDAIDVKGVSAKAAVDAHAQNGVHYAACSVRGWPRSNMGRNSPGGSGSGAEKRQMNLIRYLVSRGADVNAARSSDGWTPLYLAVVFNRKALVKLLLANGAKASVRDKEGKLPEDVADKYGLAGIKDILIHSRSRVPHSRFSCVRRGPALLSTPSSTPPTSTSTPTPTSSTETPPSPSQSISSESEANSASIESEPASAQATPPAAATPPTARPPPADAGTSEACLLTAQ